MYDYTHTAVLRDALGPFSSLRTSLLFLLFFFFYKCSVIISNFLEASPAQSSAESSASANVADESLFVLHYAVKVTAVLLPIVTVGPRPDGKAPV